MIRQSVNAGLLNGYYWNGTAMTVSNQGFAVQIDTTGTAGAVKLAGAGTTNIGIIANGTLYQVGDPISLVGVVGQVVDGIAGSAGFSAGDLIKSDSTGALVTAGSTDPWFAQALETATSGNIGQVAIMAGGSIATNVTFTRTATRLNPTNAGDTIASGPASAAGVVEILANGIAANGVGAAVNLNLTTKGAGIVNINAVPAVSAVVVPVQATTGTAGTAGRITNASITTAAVVNVTGAEAAAYVGYVIASAGFFTVYDNSGVALSGKKVNYFITSY